MKGLGHAILGISIFAGCLIGGFFVYKGLKTFTDKDRVVTVKGLAEQEIKAISSNIKISFSFSGDNLPSILNNSKNKLEQVKNFLHEKNIDEKILSIPKYNVIDRQIYYEDDWENGKRVKRKIDRYTVVQSLNFKNSEVEKVEDLVSDIEIGLIQKNLTCSFGVTYDFPELNSIKPQLIATSTQNARIAGEQFANDSKATLGKIKTASQGQFTIDGNESFTSDEPSFKNTQKPYIQKVRVVSTIVFFLE